jgi:hypothetical protein
MKYTQGTLASMACSREGGSDWLDSVPIYQTGHSLGSVLAQCAYSTCLFNPHENGYCVTFENPGSYKIVKSMLLNLGILGVDEEYVKNWMASISSKIETYQGDINIINTSNVHWGDVNWVKMPYRYDIRVSERLPIVTPLIDIDPSYIWNSFYLITNTGDQHSIDNLCAHIHACAPIVDANQREHGFVRGYQQYLRVDDREYYWADYFNYVWDDDKEARDKYLDQFDDFLRDKFDELRKIVPTIDSQEDAMVAQAQFKARTNNVFGLFSKKPALQIEEQPQAQRNVSM